MGKRLCMVRWRGAPLMGATLRKEYRCGECAQMIAKGSHAFRPMLDGNVNGVQRNHRLCEVCAESVGAEKRYIDE